MSKTTVSGSKMADLLLDWYDVSARKLPWRSGPGSNAGINPYKVWLSEVMLQQTTVATVSPYFARFTELWPDVDSLANANLDDVLSAWAGLGYYARARNLHKCARKVSEDLGGVFPDSEESLRKLPGIGAYTAAAITAIAFDRRAVVMDGNVERVMARLRAIETPLPDAKPALYAEAEKLTPHSRPGDYAQAVMDLGATICTPKSPACGVCPWTSHCKARKSGDPARLPLKRKKAPKPTRQGVAYIALDRQGRILLRTRPENGLLGGMLGLPGTDWSVEGPTPQEIQLAAPCRAGWREAPEEARHTFTHFHLRLKLMVAETPKPPKGEDDRWISPSALADHALPTLMKKAVKLGLAAFQ